MGSKDTVDWRNQGSNHQLSVSSDLLCLLNYSHPTCVSIDVTQPVFLFTRSILCRVPEACVFDGILHTLILIWDLVFRVLCEGEELCRETWDHLGFGQPGSLTHT